MKKKEEQKINRSEVAKRLREFAEMIDHGSFSVGEMTMQVPEDVNYELELEDEQGKGEIEIELKWRM